MTDRWTENDAYELKLEILVIMQMVKIYYVQVQRNHLKVQIGELTKISQEKRGSLMLATLHPYIKTGTNIMNVNYTLVMKKKHFDKQCCSQK